MLIDRPSVREGSFIENAVVPNGTTNPPSPNPGELFFRTDLGTLQTYTGSAWVEVGAGGGGALALHIANTTLHLTSAQNTLLDGLSGTLTATELNFVDGVTSPIQAQLDTQALNLSNETSRALLAESGLQSQITGAGTNLSTHAADGTLHLTSAQNTLLDGLSGTLTATELNFVDGVTSPIQSQLNTISTNLSTHAADTALHLTSSQNTLLDGITVAFADVNRLVGIDSYLSGIGSASIAAALTVLSSSKLGLTGGTMTGTIVMSGGSRVTGLPSPASDSEAANKAYVDAIAGGIKWKEAVVAATTSAIALSGLQTVDGIAVTHNQRVLVKDQASPPTNGIYIVNSSGAWSRAIDFDSALEASQCAVYVMAGGTANGSGSFIQAATISTLGVDPLTFTPFTGPVVNSAGSGISLGVGGLVSVKEAQGIAFDGGGNVIVDLHSSGGLMTTLDNTNSSTAASAQLALTNVGTPGTYRSVTTDSKGRITAGTNPTTLSGYGITDAQPLDSDLTALAAMSGSGLIVRTGVGTVANRSIAVSGSGLSISTADGVSGNPTVTSNATSANTASTIVFRDGSGNFSAGTITATTIIGALTGNVTGTASGNVARAGDTMTGALSFTGGNLLAASSPAVNQAWFSTAAYGVSQGDNRTHFGYNSAGTFVNYIRGASTIIEGNLVVGGPLTVAGDTVWTAGNDGPGSGLNADLLDGRHSWSSGVNWGIVPFVETDGVLKAGRFIDFHTTSAAGSQDARLSSGPTTFGTFALSGNSGGYQGFQFSDVSSTRTFMVRTSDGRHGMYAVGGSIWDWYYDPTLGNMLINGANPVLHSANYTSYAPSLTGAGASGTWGISITGNSATVSGFSAQAAQAANTIPVRDGSGHVFLNYINSNTGNSENPTISQVITTNGGDNFFRKSSIAHLATAVGAQSPVVTGNWLFRSTSSTAAGSNAPLQANATAGNAAYMSFYRDAAFGVNMGLDTDNVFRIGGWSASANRMQLDMSGNVTFAGNVTAFSDKRLKTDIEPVWDALQKITRLNGVTYKRIDSAEFGVGLIAQDVREVIPEAVKEQADGMLSVAYGNLVGVLVEAIKDLNRQVQELKARLPAD